MSSFNAHHIAGIKAISHYDHRFMTEIDSFETSITMNSTDVLNTALGRDSLRAHRRNGAALFIRMLVCVTAIALHGGCVLLFPTEAGDDLPHFADQAPQPGEPVPNINVRKLDGSIIELAELFGNRPVVLQLGSHSCPVYRYRRFDMFKLQDAYQDRVDFVVVYTTEAHPVGAPSPYRDEEWLTAFNWITNTRVPQPENIDERIAQAIRSTDELERSDLVVVDQMDDLAWRSYGSAPSAAFVIDSQGEIVLSQPWVEPNGIREALDALLSNAERHDLE